MTSNWTACLTLSKPLAIWHRGVRFSTTRPTPSAVAPHCPHQPVQPPNCSPQHTQHCTSRPSQSPPLQPTRGGNAEQNKPQSANKTTNHIHNDYIKLSCSELSSISPHFQDCGHPLALESWALWIELSRKNYGAAKFGTETTHKPAEANLHVASRCFKSRLTQPPPIRREARVAELTTGLYRTQLHMSSLALTLPKITNTHMCANTAHTAVFWPS